MHSMAGGPPLPWVPRVEIAPTETPLQLSVAESAALSSPPARKALSRHINADVLQRLSAQMAVIGPLHTRRRVVSFGVGLQPVDRYAHNLSKQLADFILIANNCQPFVLFRFGAGVGTLVYLSSLEN